MTSFSLDMAEVEALAGDLERAADEVVKISGDVLDDVSAKFVASAKADAPVDTGATRDSIRAESDGGDMRTIVADTRAAFFQEFGTSKMPPHPFMWPQVPAAVAQMTTEFENINPFE